MYYSTMLREQLSKKFISKGFVASVVQEYGKLFSLNDKKDSATPYNVIHS